MKIIPIFLDKEFQKFDIYEKIINNNNNIQFRDGDLLIISSKYLSISEGRVKKLHTTKPSKKAIKLSKIYHIEPTMVELIIRESDIIFNGLYGFILTSIQGVLAPNAGIDRSNIPKGYVVLYPKDPYSSINTLRQKFFVNL